MRFSREIIICLLLTVFSAGISQANLILNGDFENNTAISSQFNLPNANFNTYVSNVTAFGAAQEIDLVKGSDYGIAPQSGDWKLGLHTQTISSPTYDAFTFELSSPIISGTSYMLQFYSIGGSPDYNYTDIGNIQVGLSNSETDFGDLLLTATPNSATWTLFSVAFNAPSGASHLSVRSDPSLYGGYLFVDNFSLVESAAPVPEPSTFILLGAGLAGLVAWRRKRS